MRKMDNFKNLFKVKHWEYIKILLVIYDILTVTLSFALSLWVRYDFRYSTIPQNYLYIYVKFAPIYAIFCVICFRLFKLYSSIWRFASYREFENTTYASIVCLVFHYVGQSLLFGKEPIVYYFLGILLQFLFTLGIRFSYRFVSLIKKRRKDDQNGKAQNVMIIGAGEVGRQIVHSINERNITGSKARCIIDDNPNKWNRYIEGIRVVGDRNTIVYNIEKYDIDKIYFCIANIKAKNRQEILEICKETGKPVMNVPPIDEIDRNKITEEILKPVTIEDLLGREPVKVATDEILSYVKDKTVMITGGGGSIGSELARQIASHQPKCLVLLDIYENTLYELQQDLLSKYPSLNLKAVIASVCDSRRMMSVFKKYKPDVVYHAAAHKHVPLMEYSPHEAIKNNTVGTYKTAYAALMNGCKRFVLISTDKAVNPTNIMGASKRLCEMVIQSFDYMVKHGIADRINPLRFHTNKETDNKNTVMPEKFVTEFVAVRFGNVLGSNGSVIPLFRKQIERGGPVTVTHPDIIRYFMTIPEAASLVLLAGTYAKGGEIFVLDMGNPVKIDTLARNLITLSGLKPDEDIKIEYTGLRPGEKLYEEKLMAEEGLQKTANDKIHIGKPIEFDMEAFIQKLDGLMMMSYDDDADIISAVSELVPTYRSGKKASEVPNEEKYNSLLKEAEGKS